MTLKRVVLSGEKNTGRAKALFIASIAQDKKGSDIVLLDLRKISNFCDWFVVLSASSTRRVQAIAASVQKALLEKDVHPLHVEGRHNQYWVLLDYGDVVVHIFYKDVRDFYGLERLWRDAPQECFNEKCLKKTIRKKSRKSS